jgi:hypothetical protein
MRVRGEDELLRVVVVEEQRAEARADDARDALRGDLRDAVEVQRAEFLDDLAQREEAGGGDSFEAAPEETVLLLELTEAVLPLLAPPGRSLGHRRPFNQPDLSRAIQIRGLRCFRPGT